MIYRRTFYQSRTRVCKLVVLAKPMYCSECDLAHLDTPAPRGSMVVVETTSRYDRSWFHIACFKRERPKLGRRLDEYLALYPDVRNQVILELAS